MRALIDDKNPIYVVDKTPNNEVVYDLSFRFDPNSIRMANQNTHTIFLGEDVTSSLIPVLRVDLRFINGVYQLRAISRNDNLTWATTAWSTISDARHEVEVEWDAASPGETDGNLTFKIDGVLRGDLLGLDNNNFRIDQVRLGAVSGLDSGTSGTTFFDLFESFR
jgi:hypothetical protein